MVDERGYRHVFMMLNFNDILSGSLCQSFGKLGSLLVTKYCTLCSKACDRNISSCNTEQVTTVSHKITELLLREIHFD
jgi:hypothetical protein